MFRDVNKSQIVANREDQLQSIVCMQCIDYSDQLRVSTLKCEELKRENKSLKVRLKYYIEREKKLIEKEKEKEDEKQKPKQTETEKQMATEKIETEKQMEKETTKKERKRHGKRCSVCNDLMTESELSRHLCMNRTEMTCDYCPMTFKATIDLGVHLMEAKHKVTFYRCDHCSKAFASAILLKIHQSSYQSNCRAHFKYDIHESPMTKSNSYTRYIYLFHH